MAGYTYNSYTAALQVLVVSQSPDAPFDTILPSCIDYASLRIDRDLNLISAVQSDASTVCTLGERLASIPETFVTTTNFNILTPAGSTATNGERVPLIPVSRDVIDMLWPGNAVANRGVPAMFAMVDQWSIILGPSPDAAYGLEVVGTTHPAVLSASNTTTFISTYLPDLFIAASMVFFSGYMRNFGAQASDPAQGMSWEQVYTTLLKSAETEESRKRYWSSSWTSQPTSQEAVPSRG